MPRSRVLLLVIANMLPLFPSLAGPCPGAHREIGPIVGGPPSWAARAISVTDQAEGAGGTDSSRAGVSWPRHRPAPLIPEIGSSDSGLSSPLEEPRISGTAHAALALSLAGTLVPIAVDGRLCRGLDFDGFTRA